MAKTSKRTVLVLQVYVLLRSHHPEVVSLRPVAPSSCEVTPEKGCINPSHVTTVLSVRESWGMLSPACTILVVCEVLDTET